ncbi:response regulator [Luteolibacter arcticus]|uniref:Response regulator n=1 Tax=Luteolibacter arcticus TaxID=1581411 RepID=A0ABT3GJY0_9BACT|nr:response regulator [Luteolibacter arcticus]MCW1923832.1 response regulator [Luteolibacter arcticus]
MSEDRSAPAVYIVDDDASVCRCLARMVRQASFEARTFSSAEDFLAARPVPWPHPACLILDLQMPGLGGLELQRELASEPAPCPVIFISGNGDIPSTVQAMRQGAVTFLTKPFDDEDLLQAVRDAIETHRALIESTSQVERLRRQIDSLTEREREVMAWVISGALNKQIADELGVVEQTVKVHRGRVMEKMKVVSVAQLVRACVSVGFEAAVK